MGDRKKITKKIKYALRFIPDPIFLQLYYFAVFHRFANLKNPHSFDEKLNWLKLHDRKPEYCDLVDKYKVKSIVAEQIGEEYIIPTLGVWDHFDEIDFDLLPNQFVLKCTHDSEGLVIVKDKSEMDRKAAKEKLEASLKNNFYYIGREWPYKNVQPRIIAEQYMEDSVLKELRDYKFFCFNGEPKLMFVASGRNDKGLRIDYFDLQYRHLDLVRKPCPNAEEMPEKPKNFEKMIHLSRVLSKGKPHLRVDFYEVNGKVYFGELTFFNHGGFGKYSPEKWNYILGEWLELPKQ